ncbi:MAG: DUF373 family protein [Crenarchaeota archaeon]|nr:DUF373 family protein [Thermoproteota archaeon]
MRRRLLVLAVDVDDDLSGAGIRTPIYGRERVLEAATRFALYDPEDSDLNTLFAAVKIADQLRREGYDAVPAVVAGSRRGGVEAGLAIQRQLVRLLEETGADGVVVVSDGSEDESVIPVISSVAPVRAVHRVVVKQHRGVEETYILLARYLRKALTEPRFARTFVGIPGIILVVVSALSLLGLLREALLVGLLILGVAMVVRGFELEDRIASVVTETPVSLIAYGTATLSFLLALGLLATQLVGGVSNPEELASALKGFTSLVGFAASIAVFGHVLSKLISGDLRPGREALVVTVITVAVVLLNKIADAVALMEALTVSEFIAALVEVNFILYAVAGMLIVAVTWKLSRLLDERIAGLGEEAGEEASGRTASRGAGTSREPGTAPRG